MTRMARRDLSAANRANSANPSGHPRHPRNPRLKHLFSRGSCLILQPSIKQIDELVTVGRIDLGVGDLHDSCALVVQALEKLHDLSALTRVEIAGGLVGENQARIGDN